MSRLPIIQTTFKPVSAKTCTHRVWRAAVPVWRMAAREFVIAVSEKIQVETGMSMSSIQPLARVVRAVQQISYKPTRSPRKGYTNIQGIWIPRGVKGPQTGMRLGEKMFNFNIGSPSNPTFYFDFSINVYQWAFHEPDWQAITSGWERFNQVIDLKMPDVIGDVIEKWVLESL